MKLKIILLVSLFLTQVHALEADNFTDRFSPLPDAREALNKETNRLLGLAVERANNSGSLLEKEIMKNPGGGQCNPKVMQMSVMRHLGSGVKPSGIEKWAIETPQIQRHKPKDNYVYRHPKDGTNGVKVNEQDFLVKSPIPTASVLLKAAIDPSLNVNGQYVGTDKLGHFFDQGYTAYEKSKDATSFEEGVTASLKHSESAEETIWGLIPSGIKSYGDLSANYSGFLFWTQLTEGSNPYFRCSNGVWSQVRNFDWAEYVMPSWDEAINCSQFSVKATLENYVANTQNLEKAAKNRGKSYKYTCPVSARECVKMKAQYGSKAPYLLSPACLKAKVGDGEEMQYTGQSPASDITRNIVQGGGAREGSGRK
jgi:hypothetical protein